MDHEEREGFTGWAIVELFGHNQIAGHVSDVSMFGTSMMRVDVPNIGDAPGYTKFFGGSAIYAVTPTTEKIARIAAEKLDVRPVAAWVVPEARPQLSQGVKGYHPHSPDYASDQDDEPEDQFEPIQKFNQNDIPF